MKLISAFLTSLVLTIGAQTLWAADPVNINTASAEELAEAISGVGIKRAQMIVEYRKLYGPFTSVEELGNVDGIGDKTIEKNLEQLTTQ